MAIDMPDVVSADELRDMFGGDTDDILDALDADSGDDTEHWHVMVSLPGCLPDSHDVYDSRESAIDGICDTYPEYADKLRRRFTRGDSSAELSSLHRPYGYYVELWPCNSADCEDEHSDGYGY